MDIKLKVSDSELEQLICQHIARKTVDNHSFRYDMRDAVGKAIKEYVYNNKENIIEMVVDRASREMVKKGLPKLLDKF